MKLHLFIISLCVVTGWVQGRFLNFAQSMLDRIRNPWWIHTPPGCVSCIQTAARNYFEDLRFISPDCAGHEIEDFDNINNGGVFYNICKFPLLELYRNTYKELTVYGKEVLDYFVGCFEEDYTDEWKTELQKYNKAFDDSRRMCGEPKFLEDDYQYFVSLASDKPPPPKDIPSTKGSFTTGLPDTTPTDLLISETDDLPPTYASDAASNDSLEVASTIKPVEPQILSPVMDEISENVPQTLSDDGSEQLELELPSSTLVDNPDTTTNDLSEIAFKAAMVEPQSTAMLRPGPDEIPENNILIPSNDSEQPELELIASTLDDTPPYINEAELQSKLTSPSLDLANLELDSQLNMLNPTADEELVNSSTLPADSSEQSELELIASPPGDTPFSENVDGVISNLNGLSSETSNPEPMDMPKLESESLTQPDRTTFMSQEIPNSTSSEPSQISSMPVVTPFPLNDLSKTVSNNALGQEPLASVKIESESTEAVPIHEESHLVNEPILTDLPEDSSNDSIDFTSNDMSPDEPSLPLKNQSDHELSMLPQSDILEEESVATSSNEFPQDLTTSEPDGSTTQQESQPELPLNGTLSPFAENQIEPQSAHPIPVDQLDSTQTEEPTINHNFPEPKIEPKDSSETQPTLTAPEAQPIPTLSDEPSSVQLFSDPNTALEDQSEPYPITPTTLQNQGSPNPINIPSPVEHFPDPNTSLGVQNDSESIIPTSKDQSSSAPSDASPSVQPISQFDVTLKDQTEPELSDSIPNDQPTTISTSKDQPSSALSDFSSTTEPISRSLTPEEQTKPEPTDPELDNQPNPTPMNTPPKESLVCYRKTFVQLFQNLNVMCPECGIDKEIRAFRKTIKKTLYLPQNEVNEGKINEMFLDRMKNADTLGTGILAKFQDCLENKCKSFNRSQLSQYISMFEKNQSTCGQTMYFEDAITRLQNTYGEQSEKTSQ